MRQIGLIPKGTDPKTLTDHLTALGMQTRADERPDGWMIWIYDENHLGEARRELLSYVENPADARYHEAELSAERIRQEKERLEKEYRKNVRSLSGRWDQANLRRRPLTVALMAISIIVYFCRDRNAPDLGKVYNSLLFSSRTQAPEGGLPNHGLDDIFHGQVWRLITPIFLHFSPLHILFNLWWLRDLGSMIEYRRGTRTLALVVLLSALASNTGEFAFGLFFRGAPPLFGGMSGVVYALFGYVWMKGNHEPEQGMMLHPYTIQFMIFWLVLCFTGWVGPIANTAHILGLVVGVLCGLARF